MRKTQGKADPQLVAKSSKYCSRDDGRRLRSAGRIFERTHQPHVEGPLEPAVGIRPAQRSEKPLLVSMIRAAVGNPRPLGLDLAAFPGYADIVQVKSLATSSARTPCDEVRGYGPHFTSNPAGGSRGLRAALVEALWIRHPLPLWLTCRRRPMVLVAHSGQSIVALPRKCGHYFHAAWRRSMPSASCCLARTVWQRVPL